MKKEELMFDKKDFEGRKIKCAWCANFVEDKCSIKKIKIKARKSRKCTFFDPSTSKITKEINRGKDIPTTRLSPMAYMSKSERKKYIEDQKRKLDEAIRDHESHPFTGDLSKFKTTAESD